MRRWLCSWRLCSWRLCSWRCRLCSWRWLRRLLRVVGTLPLLLDQAALRPHLQTWVNMAGFDKVDPANAYVLCTGEPAYLARCSY
jgi:hypothetical protein